MILTDVNGRTLFDMVRGKRVYIAGPVRYSELTTDDYHPAIGAMIGQNIENARAAWLRALELMFVETFHAASATSGPGLVSKFVENTGVESNERAIMALCLRTIVLETDILIMTNSEYYWASSGCMAEKTAMESVGGDVIMLPYNLEKDLAYLSLPRDDRAKTPLDLHTFLSDEFMMTEYERRHGFGKEDRPFIQLQMDIQES